MLIAETKERSMLLTRMRGSVRLPLKVEDGVSRGIGTAKLLLGIMNEDGIAHRLEGCLNLAGKGSCFLLRCVQDDVQRFGSPAGGLGSGRQLAHHTFVSLPLFSLRLLSLLQHR